MSYVLSATRSGRSKSVRIAAGVLLAFVTTVASVGWLFRAEMLSGMARAWTVSDPITPADAVAVLGGGLETRPFAAADLYKQGVAKRILLAGVRLSPAEKLGVLPSHEELNRAVLLKLGVPPEAMTRFGADVSNTFEEAKALVEWAKANGIKKIIVPTEIFSSRRVSWILHREAAAAGVGVEIMALPPSVYDADDWWRHSQGMIAFQNEVIKYLYYRIRY
jgi:uncharacterized SAM-binding protein YcdF (DUF218 family)